MGEDEPKHVHGEIVERKESMREQQTRVWIHKLEEWVDVLEERARLLMNYEPTNITESERENAATRILALVGKYIEVIHNFESELLGEEDEKDSPQALAALLKRDSEFPRLT